MAAVRGIGNLCCPCRRWSGRTPPPFPPPRFAQTQPVAFSTHHLFPSSITSQRNPCQIAPLIRPCKNPNFFDRTLLVLYSYLGGRNHLLLLGLRCLFECAGLRRGEATAAPGGCMVIDGGRWRVDEEGLRRRRRKMRAGRCRALGHLSTPCMFPRHRFFICSWFLPPFTYPPVSACS